MHVRNLGMYARVLACAKTLEAARNLRILVDGDKRVKPVDREHLRA